MTTARKKCVSLEVTRFYHCITRCVRQAHLCGRCEKTGKSYNHRRKWVEDRLLQLATAFSIKICAYSVMHNHIHCVLFVDKEKALNWSKREVLFFWCKAFKGSINEHLYLDITRCSELLEHEILAIEKNIEIYRKRLYSISWFMRQLNQYIARRANIEDKCTGHFWEGRFISKALLTENSVLAAMVYNELNPIRAGLSVTPESSAYTSIKMRLSNIKHNTRTMGLISFSDQKSEHSENCLPISFSDYATLVEVTGRIHIEGKGHIENRIKPILERWQLKFENWYKLTSQLDELVSIALGHPNDLAKLANNTGRIKRPDIFASNYLKQPTSIPE